MFYGTVSIHINWKNLKLSYLVEKQSKYNFILTQIFENFKKIYPFVHFW